MSTAMKRWYGERLAVALMAAAGVLTLVACERDASGLTEWTAADHDHQVEAPRRRRSLTQAAPQTPHAAPSKRNQLVDVTWAKQCATCHGKKGRGDGPSSTMVKARDLTTPEWQASVSDEQLKKVIREGKDKMPAFNLPDSTINDLVQHVRSLERKPRGGDEPEAQGDEGEDAEPAAPNAPASASSAPAPAAPSAPGAPVAAPNEDDTGAHAPTATPPKP
jgi:cytochrome c oxidase cbb3-type subunit 3